MIFLLALVFGDIELPVPQLSAGDQYGQARKSDLLDSALLEISASNAFPESRFTSSDIPSLGLNFVSGGLFLKETINPSLGIGFHYSLGHHSQNSALVSQNGSSEHTAQESISLFAVPLWAQMRGLFAEFYHFSPLLRAGVQPTWGVIHDSELGKGKTEFGTSFRWSAGIVFEPRSWLPKNSSGWSFLIPRGLQFSYLSTHSLSGKLESSSQGLELGLWMPL